MPRRLISVIDPVTNELCEPAEYAKRLRHRAGVRNTGPMVCPDRDLSRAVKSPVDGTWITSRAELREHNIRNDCIDVGNDKAVLRSPGPDLEWDDPAPMIRAGLMGEMPVEYGGPSAESFTEPPD